ncbi:unnamed protein product [Adineta ricciae]|uniref:RING-type domain-containing protein n=1 Tax=Adineta ricciae TaxID=249248 RepID=A0A814FW36_ADIRI|nr:unnamed protein product [Adineta ricciae]
MLVLLTILGIEGISQLSQNFRIAHLTRDPMIVPGQAQPPPLPPILPPPHPPEFLPQDADPQDPPTCLICLNDVQPNEPILTCRVCYKVFHYGELLTWLTNRRNLRERENCPNCRTDMGWVLNPPPLPQPPPPPPPPPADNFDGDAPLGVQPAELDNINNWDINGMILDR